MIVCWATSVGVGTAQAGKSVFIISKHSVPSQAQAYAIEGDQVIYHAQVDIDPLNAGYGSVGNAVWSDRELMFVTYESSPMIVWASTKTLLKVGEFDTGINNLSGIVVDEGKARIYVVERMTNGLYVYSYDRGNNTLILEQYCELVLPYPGEYVTAWGIALDEQSGLLYVSNAHEYVDVFSTSDWSHDHYIEIKVNDTVRHAVGIAVDPTPGYLYTGGYNLSPGGIAHNYLVRTETSDLYGSIEENIGQPVIGIGVDEDTGLVYCTTQNDDFRVYDCNLVLKDTEENDDISGPAGVAVPSGDVSYKARFPYLTLVKDDNDVDCAYPYNFIDHNYLVYHINYDANGYSGGAAVITDYLHLM